MLKLPDGAGGWMNRVKEASILRFIEKYYGIWA